jgi:hypothetical protein
MNTREINIARQPDMLGTIEGEGPEKCYRFEG